MSAHYLAIDQGTHASRAIVFDERGVVAASAHRDVSLRRLQPGWVEQDPDEILTSISECLLSPGLSEISVDSAALATQRSSVVCWDRQTGKALTPVLGWQDTRAEGYLAFSDSRRRAIREKTGLPVSAHYGASKLRWCLDHLPEVETARRENRLCAGPLASWLVFHLARGRPFVCDPANAGRTLLFNRHTLDWDDELIGWFGLDRRFLPRCTPTRFDYGQLTVGASRPPLRIITGDQPAALFACGNIHAATAYINLGTGAFVQRQLPASAQAPEGLLESVVYHDQSKTLRMLEATVNGAGAALSWLLDKSRHQGEEKNLAQWMNNCAEPPLFLNGVGGLAAPYWRPDFESRFIGAGDYRQQAVAVAESILFLLMENMKHMADAAGDANAIVISGGLARVDPLCQKLANLSGASVLRYREHEATAKGAAWLLAERGRGQPVDWCARPRQFEPRVDEPLARRYSRWRKAMTRALGES